MDFIDNIKKLSSKIPAEIDHIKTEEATKTSFIMPFISALGYDIHDPMEVVPESIADFGTKKGEKVDYAIKKDGKIIILIECKWSGEKLHFNHTEQLSRYFSVTDARFAILTNGVVYQFYSDIDKENKMDTKPFFTFNILDFHDHEMEELKKFTKSAFSLEYILATANMLKYTGAIKKILENELTDPTEPFVRFFASQVFDGNLTKRVIDDFTKIVKDARTQFINEKINEHLKSSAILPNSSAGDENKDIMSEKAAEEQSAEQKSGIETTVEEIEAYNIIKAILREKIDVKRIVMRDQKSYCGILLDDNNRKRICLLRFNYSQKYLGVFSDKKEEKIAIEDVDDIFNHADRIINTVQEYEREQ